MSAEKPTFCPKCGYTRTAADKAPEWQCPACGIAYVKFRGRARPRRGYREHTTSTGRRDRAGTTAAFVYGGVLIATFAPMWFLASFWPIRWMPVVMVICAFLFWLGAYRRLRVVADVPTSTIAAAAQGYTELRGKAAAAPGHSLTGYLTRTPCIWYRYVWTQAGDHERQDAGERGVPFLLRDRTGECLVDLEHAEVICDRREMWTRDDGVYEEWSIRVGDPVYAIGHFTSGGPAVEAYVNLKVAYALAAQERDAEGYAARYDADGDGRVSRQETARARDALRREAMREFAVQGGTHALGPSPDGRPFLVVGADHDRIIRRYRILSMAHLAVFFAAIAFGWYIWNI